VVSSTQHSHGHMAEENGLQKIHSLQHFKKLWKLSIA
jgi:hypothetical protein